MNNESFRISHSVPDQGVLLPNSPDYFLPASTNVYQLLKQLQIVLPEKVDRAIEIGLKSTAWSKDFISLKDIPNFSAQFEPWTGAIKLPKLAESSPLQSFFSLAGRASVWGQNLMDRGARYYLVTDPALGGVETKLSVLRKDMADALAIVVSVDRQDLTPDCLPYYLGVLDYLKQDTLALYHVMIQPEKEGQIDNLPADWDKLKGESFQLARQFTRMYYQACLGRHYDTHVSVAATTNTIDQIKSYIQTNLNSVSNFKLPEIDHPLKIMLSASRAVSKNQEVDTILALPRGSTQVGIAIQLGYELLQGFSPELIMVPLSIYSHRTQNQGVPIADQFVHYIQRFNLADRVILLVDDNSHTARTLKVVIDAEKQVGNDDNAVAIVEVDPIRVISRFDSGKNLDQIANFLHSDILDTAVGVLPILHHKSARYNTSELRKILARKVLEQGPPELIQPISP